MISCVNAAARLIKIETGSLLLDISNMEIVDLDRSSFSRMARQRVDPGANGRTGENRWRHLL